MAKRAQREVPKTKKVRKIQISSFFSKAFIKRKKKTTKIKREIKLCEISKGHPHKEPGHQREKAVEREALMRRIMSVR